MTKTKVQQGVEFVEIHRSQIKAAYYNPRSINPTNRKRLRGSIKKHGLVDTLVWNKRTGNIVGGHQRLGEVDEIEGSADYTITVQQIDVDEQTEMQLNLALNNKNMQGQFEQDLLKEMLSSFVDGGIDLEPTGFSTADVQTMFPDIIFSQEIAEQEQAEANDVALISNMAQAGRDHEAQFRAAMGLDSKMPDVDPLPADYDAEGGESSWAGQSDDDRQDSESPPPQPEHVERGWTQPKDYFQAKREGVERVNEVKSQTDVMLTLTFQTNRQLQFFMELYGFDQTKRVVGPTEIEVGLGIELPRD